MSKRATRSSKRFSPVNVLEAGGSQLSSDESDDEPLIRKTTKKSTKRKITDSSSSESDIENYLQPVDKIDLNSSFFDVDKPKDSSFDQIEKEIFSGIKVSKLSDSDSSDDENINEEKIVPAKNEKIADITTKVEILDEEIHKSLKEGDRVAALNFKKLHDFTKQIEETQKTVQQYMAQDRKEEKVESEEAFKIEDLLAAGELKQNLSEVKQEQVPLNSSSFETYSDSEQEDWEEINEKQENDEKSIVPKGELEIMVEMPNTVRKKKGDDFISAIKRRLNRIRKENQLLIHKVHLLCWLAHGNFVNSVINDQCMLGQGLSLIATEKCFPSGRIDLGYLEQILKWYRRTIKLNERVPSKSKSLCDLLSEQMEKKEAYTKKMFVIIFIIILRSLGIDSRLVLSLQVEPLRPPNSDLHFLGKSSDSTASSKQPENNSSFAKSEKHEKNPKIIITADSKQYDLEKKSEKSTANSSQKLSSNASDKGRKSSSSKTKSISTPAVKNKKEMEENKESYLKKKSDRDKQDKKSESPSKQIRKEKSSSSSHKDGHDRKKKETKESDQKKRKGDRDEHDEDSQSPSKITKKESSSSSSGKDGSDRRQKEKLRNEATKDRIYKNTNQGKVKAGNHEGNKLTVHLDKLKRVTRSQSKSPSVESEKNIRSKSASMLKEKVKDKKEDQRKSRVKSTSSISKDVHKEKINQFDGSDDAVEEFKGFERSPNGISTNVDLFEKFYAEALSSMTASTGKRSSLMIPQLDGGSDELPSLKPNFKKLKKSKHSENDNCKSRKHRSAKKTNYMDEGSSDGDFIESPTKKFKADVDDGSKKRRSRYSMKEEKKDIVKDFLSNRGKSLDVTKDIVQLLKGRIKEQKQAEKSRTVKKKKKVESDSEDSDYVPEQTVTKNKNNSDSDDDFFPRLKGKQRAKKEVIKVKKVKKTKDPNSRKVISSDSEYTEEEVVVNKPKEKKRGNDVWLEVFLETEEKWISVDVIFGQVHCVNELYNRASHPVSYVLAWNNIGHVKDITRRYCQNFNTVTRKLRIDKEWWEESLKAFVGPKNAKDREEDDELNREQLEKPLPTTISEYKNHPLYALERHLLKFEALYPPNATPLGYVRKEPVYPRSCVYICHSRDIWLKQAKVVKRGEKPYKIVKARPKYDKLSNTVITDQNLEIFGPWQVQDYDPPTAENGIVPRNAFGNVDLFKPSMLPKKCVHLQLPGLNKVAKRMNIDCASAIVGFDFHGGWSHPVYDGFVVCEEYEDQLVAAWNIEQEEIERKEQEKYENRVYGNWKKLIKGLLIKEKLKLKYGFGTQQEEASTSEETTSETKKSTKGPTFCTKKKG